MKRKYLFAIIYSIILIIFTIYISLDTFVNAQSYSVVQNNKTTTTYETGEITSSDSEYEDDNIKITIKEYNQNDTVIHVADVQIKNAELLKTAFANNTYGKNVTAKTSTISEGVNAILAINGDYYGVQEKGYVLKNGTIYRSTAKQNQEDLVIYEDGSFEIINETDVSIETLKQKGAYNILAFGPALVEENQISVETQDEV